jgi:hypothetical protein
VNVDPDEWPPRYPYLGARPTVWRRLLYTPGEPIRHKHACPECYEHVWCTYPCTIEPDLEDDRTGTLFGAHCVCDPCQRVVEDRLRVEEALLNGKLGA